MAYVYQQLRVIKMRRHRLNLARRIVRVFITGFTRTGRINGLRKSFNAWLLVIMVSHHRLNLGRT